MTQKLFIFAMALFVTIPLALATAMVFQEVSYSSSKASVSTGQATDLHANRRFMARSRSAGRRY